MMPRAKSSRVSGFSLIELIVSAAIVAVLASVAMPLAQTSVRRQKEHALRVALQDIRRGIDNYRIASVNGQIALVPGGSGYPPSLAELATGVPDIKTPGAPPLYFLRRIPRDPFFADQSVPAAQTWGLRSFASEPDHPLPGLDVFDIQSTSAETGFNGVPYSEW
jgi:general secretion pathway protein G